MILLGAARLVAAAVLGTFEALLLLVALRAYQAGLFGPAKSWSQVAIAAMRTIGEPMR